MTNETTPAAAPKLSPYTAGRGAHVVYPVTVDHDGVTGIVSVTFTDWGHASVNTEAHVNDDLTALTYRGTSFLIHVNAQMSAGGDWTESGTYRATATRRDSWSDATETQTRKIKAAVLAVLRDTWASNPDAVAAGERRMAQFQRDGAADELAELLPKVKAARAALKAAERRLADPDAH